MDQKIQNLLENENYEQVVNLLEENKNRIFYKDAMNLIGTSFYLKFYRNDLRAADVFAILHKDRTYGEGDLDALLEVTGMERLYELVL